MSGFYFNGTKVSGVNYNGTKVKEVYYNGTKVWTACNYTPWVSIDIGTYRKPKCTSKHTVTPGCKYKVTATGCFNHHAAHYKRGHLYLVDSKGTFHEGPTRTTRGNIGFEYTFAARSTWIQLCAYAKAGSSSWGKATSLVEVGSCTGAGWKSTKVNGIHPASRPTAPHQVTIGCKYTVTVVGTTTDDIHDNHGWHPQSVYIKDENHKIIFSGPKVSHKGDDPGFTHTFVATTNYVELDCGPGAFYAEVTNLTIAK